MPSPPGTLRLFFALLPSTEQCAALAEQVAPLVTRLNAQRVPAENLHATVCFIGAVPEEKLESLRTAAAGVRAASLTLLFEALEYWRKPGILCATASETAATAPAQLLAERLMQGTTAAGFAPDVKPFRPHLTLARKLAAARAAECEWPLVLALPVAVHCDRFVLMQSQRGESGSVYTVVGEWPLD
jgi:RNA 2',3'-cyclic 3'-phosphodiesterase